MIDVHSITKYYASVQSTTSQSITSQSTTSQSTTSQSTTHIIKSTVHATPSFSDLEKLDFIVRQIDRSISTSKVFYLSYYWLALQLSRMTWLNYCWQHISQCIAYRSTYVKPNQSLPISVQRGDHAHVPTCLRGGLKIIFFHENFHNGQTLPPLLLWKKHFWLIICIIFVQK